MYSFIYPLIHFLYIYSLLVVSKKEETIANELRDILQEASLNRPQIKSRPLPKSRSSSPPQSGSTRSPISKAGKATPTSTAGKSQKPEINGGTIHPSILAFIFLFVHLHRYIHYKNLTSF